MMANRLHQLRQEVASQHGASACRDWFFERSLGGVGKKALHEGGGQGGPDQARGDVWVCGVEFVEVRIRFPFFEDEFNLPAKAIEARNQRGRKVRTWQVGTQPDPRILFRAFRVVREQNEAKTRLVLVLAEGDAQVEGMPFLFSQKFGQ